MAARKGENRFATYQGRRRDETLSKVRSVLRALNPKHVKFKSIGALVTHVAAAAKVSRSTLNPNRNRAAYLLCANYFASANLPISEIPDEVASEFVLREKLRAARLEVGNLKSELAKGRAMWSNNRITSVGQEMHQQERAFLDTATILITVIRRFDLKVDFKNMRIRDPMPERGQSDIIAHGGKARAFLDWLKSHPGFDL